MNITFETEIEDDGRWLAEVPELPGVMAYGSTKSEAIARAEALATPSQKGFRFTIPQLCFTFDDEVELAERDRKSVV